MKLVDAFHVAEYVQKAANAIWGADDPEAQVQAAAWQETIKVKAGGADEVLRSMRARLDAPRNATGRTELREGLLRHPLPDDAVEIAHAPSRSGSKTHVRPPA